MGVRIRQRREQLGYSREELAEKLDVSSKFCSDIELGVKGVSLNTLAKLSYILSLSTDYILFGDDTKTISNNETLNQLIDTCPNEKIFYLEELVKIYIKSVKWKFSLSRGMVGKFLRKLPKICLIAKFE